MEFYNSAMYEQDAHACLKFCPKDANGSHVAYSFSVIQLHTS